MGDGHPARKYQFLHTWANDVESEIPRRVTFCVRRELAVCFGDYFIWQLSTCGGSCKH